MKFKMTLAAVMLFAAPTFATADIFDVRVTELWAGGLPGPDGTADWFEITNFGDTTVDTGDIFWDDNNPMVATGGLLESLALPPGESAIFLTSVSASNPLFDNSFLEFLAIWGNPGLIGIPAGGGNLGGGGDSVNLFQLDGSNLIPIDTMEYTGEFAATLFTIERTGQGSSDIRLSVLGENGAIESNPFQNDMMMDVVMVGSPGVFEGKLMDFVLGDVNCDGDVNLLDVSPFVAAVTSGNFNAKADTNEDGVVSLLDVAPFVALVTGG